MPPSPLWSNKLTVLKATPQELTANSYFHEKFLELATHGHWLAKVQERARLATDRAGRIYMYEYFWV